MAYSIDPIANEDRRPSSIFSTISWRTPLRPIRKRNALSAFDLLCTCPWACRQDLSEIRRVGLSALECSSHHPTPAFAQTAEVTYFIHPDHTGKGLGKRLLGFLEKGALEKGITNLLASISSLNPGSVEFHQKHGFTECGRFRKVGKKKGREFDTVWMQKRL